MTSHWAQIEGGSFILLTSRFDFLYSYFWRCLFLKIKFSTMCIYKAPTALGFNRIIWCSKHYISRWQRETMPGVRTATECLTSKFKTRQTSWFSPNAFIIHLFHVSNHFWQLANCYHGEVCVIMSWKNIRMFQIWVIECQMFKWGWQQVVPLY